MQTIFDAYAVSRDIEPPAPVRSEGSISMSVWQLTRSFSTAVASRGRRALLDQIYASSFWRHTLGGPAPDRILYFPRTFQRRNVRLGQQIVNGYWRLPGGAVEHHDVSPFSAAAPNDIWAEALHGFGWLSHLEALGTDTARTMARHAISHWLTSFSGFHPVGWRAHVAGRRIISWLAHGRFVLAESDPLFRSHVLWSLARQARHLTRTAASAPEGLPRITAASAVTLSGLCLPDGEKRLAVGAHALVQELSRQILPDGAHVSRCPEILGLAMADVLSVLGAYKARDISPPPELRRALDRMAPALRFFCHGDGRLACFNGGSEGPDGWPAQLLSLDDAQGAPLDHASHVGFHRLTAGDALLIADTGAPPPPEHSSAAHAGTLSFEFSHGQERILVNCGTALMRGMDWRASTRATAAHTTVIVSDTSSSQLLSKGLAHHLLGAQLIGGPKNVRSKRGSDVYGQTILMSHDGYMPLFGITHQRSLALSADGLELKGEDSLNAPARPQGSAAVPAAARFHLHPAVKASLAADGHSVWLATGAGTWRFRAEGGTLALSESVYCGDGEDVRRTSQIIVSARVEGGKTTRLQWSLRKE